MRQARFNYDAIGSTRYDETPAGYHRLEHRARLGAGNEVFQRAGEALMTWRMQRRAGLPFTADGRADAGVNALGQLGVGMVVGRLRTAVPLALVGLPIPCRVVWTVEEPDRIGFAYGSLQGHPEAGEESFVVTREVGGIYFTVKAYSRAAAWYARLGGPATRTVQRLAARRYANSLRRLAVQ
ncbi:DUF1990 domain-containing protein [Kribbella sandramycini]|uniref:DUF1990 domain-containing protein n=1 Tax=Kribbella sandramycini TaxID=60450 RepID=A0A7Y4P4V6_9ACTN|nr:DUF1990 domain-containing protein [Kribbella sandramycini]